MSDKDGFEENSEQLKIGDLILYFEEVDFWKCKEMKKEMMIEMTKL